MVGSASLKRGDVVSDQRTTSCSACKTFVEVVGGIRGAEWEREHRLRHFYIVAGSGKLRGSPSGLRFVVTGYFFSGVHNACGRWLFDHLDRETVAEYRESDPRAHVAAQNLPLWVPLLIRDIDFDRPIGRAAVVTVCAKLLGISNQQVYAQLA